MPFLPPDKVWDSSILTDHVWHRELLQCNASVEQVFKKHGRCVWVHVAQMEPHRLARPIDKLHLQRIKASLSQRGIDSEQFPMIGFLPDNNCLFQQSAGNWMTLSNASEANVQVIAGNHRAEAVRQLDLRTQSTVSTYWLTLILPAGRMKLCYIFA